MDCEGDLKCGRTKIKLQAEGPNDWATAEWNAREECTSTVFTSLEIGIALGDDFFEAEEIGTLEIISLGPEAMSAGWIITAGFPLCPDCALEGLALGVMKLDEDFTEEH
jgi:hypothetical protein